jgi:exodeoxyribonuclease III
MSNILRIYSWNVNGIRAVLRKDLLYPFFEQEKPDILCVQETKMQPGEATIHLPEFHQDWYSAEKKGYSGTALFSKPKPNQTAHGLPIAIEEGYGIASDPYGNANAEGRVLTVEYPSFFLVTVYTPNAKDDLSRIPMRTKWDPAFLAHCKNLEKQKPVVFCGDLNVAHTEDDLANPKPNEGKKGFTTEERSGFQNFLNAGFVDTFRLFTQGNGHYTWWSNFGNARERNVGWRIDYILVSRSLQPYVVAAAIHPLIMGSDHCPVSIQLQLP